MEMLVLCALAPVDPGMSKADHLQICHQNSWAQTIRCASAAWTGSGKFLTRIRSSYGRSWKWEMSTPDNMDKVCNTRLRALQTLTRTFSFPSWSLCTYRYN